MKAARKSAKELAGKTGAYSIKVKLIQKTDVYTSLQAKLLDYQILTFQDEEGSQLQTILFNDPEAELPENIENQMEYEISNAKVGILQNSAEGNQEDQMYQLHFNANTIVKRICNTDFPVQANYILIASIPKVLLRNDRYDVLGVVIYVDPKCKITKPNGQTRDICEVLIVDQSSEQIIIITAWEDEAIEECQNLQSVTSSFPVISFTDLRSTRRKGFSLAITPHTTISLDPPTEAAAALRTWKEANQEFLAAKSDLVFAVRHPPNERRIITLEELLQKQAKDTIQEEKHWLRVQLSKHKMICVHLYLGCSNCGTGNSEAIGMTFNCYDCIQENVISCPRMSIIFEAVDETGSYIFGAFTRNTEQLLQIDAAGLYSMQPQERDDYIHHIERQLKSTPFYIQVGPATSLSQKQDLTWFPQEISLS